LREGLDAFIGLHAESSLPHISARVPDLLAWSRAVWTFSKDMGRTRAYIKAFVLKHAAATGWFALFLTDNLLREEQFLLPAPGQGGAKLSTSARVVPAHGGGRYGWATGAPDPPFCYSRMSPKSKCRLEPLCRFDHRCPCCTQVHAAAVCPSWCQRVADTVCDKRAATAGGWRS
jgi:hypothetical protein